MFWDNNTKFVSTTNAKQYIIRSQSTGDYAAFGLGVTRDNTHEVLERIENELFNSRVSCDTSLFYLNGLWYAELYIKFDAETICIQTRGGYANRATAKGQITRMYAQRFDTARMFKD